MIENALWFFAGYLYCTFLGAPTGALALRGWAWLRAKAAEYGFGRNGL